MTRKPPPRPVSAHEIHPRYPGDRPLQAVTPAGAQIITLVPADELPIANRY